MMATLSHPTSLPLEGDELLLITHPGLRSQLLQAQQVDTYCANCVIHRGEHVYLSLRGIVDEAKRNEVTWAVSRLQMGAQLNPRDLPDPLRTALLAAASNSRPSPLIESLIWGTLSGVVGGVLIMALAGLIMTIANVPAESYVGITATAVTFILAATVIGCSTTFYFWRRLTRQTAVSTQEPIRPTIVDKPK